MYTSELRDLRRAFQAPLDLSDPDDAEAHFDLIERIQLLGADPWASEDVEPDADELADERDDEEDEE